MNILKSMLQNNNHLYHSNSSLETWQFIMSHTRNQNAKYYWYIVAIPTLDWNCLDPGCLLQFQLMPSQFKDTRLAIVLILWCYTDIILMSQHWRSSLTFGARIWAALFTAHAGRRPKESEDEKDPVTIFSYNTVYGRGTNDAEVLTHIDLV